MYGTGAPARPRLTAGALSVGAYLAAVCVVALLPAVSGVSRGALVGSMASSPEGLADGRVWQLPLSAFIVAGGTVSQVAELAATAALLVLFAGASTFWRAAVAGHVGSTLVSYAIVAGLLAAHPSLVRGVIGAPDYGISCVWAGALGALPVAAARRYGVRIASLVLVAVSLALLELLSSGLSAAGVLQLATLEHGWAFLLGTGAAMSVRDPRRVSA